MDKTLPEKLRECADGDDSPVCLLCKEMLGECPAHEYNPNSKYPTNCIDCKCLAFKKLADEIEDRYALLPCREDGTPVHLGDYTMFKNDCSCVITSIAISNLGYRINPNAINDEWKLDIGDNIFADCKFVPSIPKLHGVYNEILEIGDTVRLFGKEQTGIIVQIEIDEDGFSCRVSLDDSLQYSSIRPKLLTKQEAVYGMNGCIIERGMHVYFKGLESCHYNVADVILDSPTPEGQYVPWIRFTNGGWGKASNISTMILVKKSEEDNEDNNPLIELLNNMKSCKGGRLEWIKRLTNIATMYKDCKVVHKKHIKEKTNGENN